MTSPALPRADATAPFHVKREAAESTPRARGPLSGLLMKVLLAPIRAYRRWISPARPARCRYYPTCSSYAEQALRELGPARGTIVAVWRLARCNPFSAGGVDELSNRRLFRAPPAPDTHPDEPANQAGERDAGR